MFLAILVLTRVTGRREAGGLGITDVLLVVLIAESAAPGLYGEAVSVTDSFVVILSILFWDLVIDALAYRSPTVARFLKSGPRALIVDGEVNRRVMRRELLTDEELEAQMRLNGVEDPNEVARAYIEPNGMISILRRDDHEEQQSAERPPSM